MEIQKSSIILSILAPPHIAYMLLFNLEAYKNLPLLFVYIVSALFILVIEDTPCKVGMYLEFIYLVVQNLSRITQN